jgi:proteic killer suppression protein
LTHLGGSAPSIRRKRKMVDAAVVLADLRAPPGNQLEALTGDRRGQHSIRINDQWRIFLYGLQKD